MNDDRLKRANEINSKLEVLKKEKNYILGNDFYVKCASKDMVIKIRQMLLDDINKAIEELEKEYEAL